jgi:CheY-like chemotaxis protein
LEVLKAATAAGKAFDAALLDLRMPVQDGAALAQQIKQDPAVGGTVLVLMSSLGQRGDAKRAAAAGFSGYLTKPIRRQHLHDCLALALGRAAASDYPPSHIITRHTIAEARRGKVRILVAEDNAVNQKVSMAILKKLGYKSDAVANGLEAIAALRNVPYDLVLMDCQMPELDGYEASRRIREQQAPWASIPIIAVTANAMEGDRARCLDAGMNDYVSKPVTAGAVAAALEKWLPKI